MEEMTWIKSPVDAGRIRCEKWMEGDEEVAGREKGREETEQSGVGEEEVILKRGLKVGEKSSTTNREKLPCVC